MEHTQIGMGQIIHIHTYIQKGNDITVKSWLMISLFIYQPKENYPALYRDGAYLIGIPHHIMVIQFPRLVVGWESMDNSFKSFVV